MGRARKAVVWGALAMALACAGCDDELADGGPPPEAELREGTGPEAREEASPQGEADRGERAPTPGAEGSGGERAAPSGARDSTTGEGDEAGEDEEQARRRLAPIQAAPPPAGTLTKFSKLPNGVELRKMFDRHGRLVMLHADGVRERFIYGPLGMLRRHITPDGRETRFWYDRRGRLSAKRGPTGWTRYEHDGGGRLLAVTTPADRVWSFRWDGDEVMGVDGPMGPVELERDPLGDVVLRRDGEGREITVLRDPDTPSIAWKTNLGDVQHLFRDASGRLLEAMADGERIGYAYDDEGRVVAIDAPGATLRYAFEGQTQVVETPWGQLRRVIEDGRLVRIETPAGAFAFEHDDDGLRQALRLPNGVVSRAEHDGLGRTTRLSVEGPAGAVLDLETGFDARHERAFTRRDGAETRYAYDHAGRLSQVAGVTSAAFAYDADGNRILEVGAAGRLEATFDGRGRLRRRGEERFEHDMAGHLTARHHAGGVDRLRYDGLDRLREVQRAGAPKVRYTYDGMARVATREVQGAVTRFVYEGARLVAELGPGERVRLFVYGPDAADPLAFVETHGDREGERVVFLHTDDRGSVLAYTDAAGRVIGRAAYGPWGELLDSPAADLPLFYAGHRVDPLAGLVYMRTRHYDPALGRFLTADAAGLEGGVNAYLYANGNPLDQVDPTGFYSVPHWAGALLHPPAVLPYWLPFEIQTGLKLVEERTAPPAQSAGERQEGRDVAAVKKGKEVAETYLALRKVLEKYERGEVEASDLTKLVTTSTKLFKDHAPDLAAAIERRAKQVDRASELAEGIALLIERDPSDPLYELKAFARYQSFLAKSVEKIPLVGEVLATFLEISAEATANMIPAAEAMDRRNQLSQIAIQSAEAGADLVEIQEQLEAFEADAVAFAARVQQSLPTTEDLIEVAQPSADELLVAAHVSPKLKRAIDASRDYRDARRWQDGHRQTTRDVLGSPNRLERTLREGERPRELVARLVREDRRWADEAAATRAVVHEAWVKYLEEEAFWRRYSAARARGTGWDSERDEAQARRAAREEVAAATRGRTIDDLLRASGFAFVPLKKPEPPLDVAQLIRDAERSYALGEPLRRPRGPGRMKVEAADGTQRKPRPGRMTIEPADSEGAAGRLRRAR